MPPVRKLMMFEITKDQYDKAIAESENFETLEEAHSEGFVSVNSRTDGTIISIQVDTKEFEWVERRNDMLSTLYYGSR